MCGFYGESFDFQRQDKGKIKQLLSLRGNDEMNTILHGSFFLMHSRLTITGTKFNSSQPIYSPSRRYLVLFNGEIYSIFGDENNEVSIYGDTVALINGLDKYGIEDCLLRLNGMFSLVILDTRKNKLILATDHFGQKPLYYAYHRDKGVVFGSTGKLVSKNQDINSSALWDYLTFGFILPEKSIYDGVVRVKPGSYISFDLEKEFQYFIKDNFQNRNYYLQEHNTQPLSDILKNSIIDHTYSDFPIALALSGGVDSTIVYGSMSPEIRDKVSTFTINDKDPVELSNATIATSYFGKATNIITPSKEQLTGSIFKVIHCLDEPNSDSAILSSNLLFNSASKEAKVILLGDGGDELFQGYNRHRMWNKIKLPNIFGGKIVYAFIPLLFSLKFFLQKLDKEFYAQKLSILINLLDNLENKDQYILSALAIDEFDKDKYKYQNSDLSINSYDKKYYLPGNNLYRVDRISLLNSIEARAPFLDLRVQNYANRIDFNKKANQDKKLLIAHRKNMYPSCSFNNKKMGFNIDISSLVTDIENRHLLEKGKNMAQKIDFPLSSKLSTRRKFNLFCLGAWLQNN